MSDDTFSLRVESDITALSPDAWNACANPPLSRDISESICSTLKNRGNDAGLEDAHLPPQLTAATAERRSYNPFVSHEFLAALEESGSAAPATGWLPQHLVLEAPDGTVIGACPAYLKSHSKGEYVFDGGWAEAYERAGGRYYPKLQISVPFTPATGPRLLAAPGPLSGTARTALAEGLVTLAGMRKVSSVHATFLEEADAAVLEEEGFLPAPTSSSTGTIAAMATSTPSSANSPRASASRSSASGAKPWRTASPSTGSPARTSPRRSGTPSSISTWRPARANGDGPT